MILMKQRVKTALLVILAAVGFTMIPVKKKKLIRRISFDNKYAG